MMKENYFILLKFSYLNELALVLKFVDIFNPDNN